jgi:hypothetical protein
MVTGKNFTKVQWVIITPQAGVKMGSCRLKFICKHLVGSKRASSDAVCKLNDAPILHSFEGSRPSDVAVENLVKVGSAKSEGPSMAVFTSSHSWKFCTLDAYSALYADDLERPVRLENSEKRSASPPGW